MQLQDVEPKHAIDVGAAAAGMTWSLMPHSIGELAAWFSVIWMVSRAIIFLYGKWRDRK